MSFAISSSINAAALSARRAASGSDNVRARVFVRAQPKKSVNDAICADDVFAARVRAAMAAVGGPPPTPKAERADEDGGRPLAPSLDPAFKAAAPGGSSPGSQGCRPANDFSWDPAPRGAPRPPRRASRPSTSRTSTPTSPPRRPPTTGYSAPAPAAPTHMTAPTSNGVHPSACSASRRGPR